MNIQVNSMSSMLKVITSFAFTFLILVSSPLWSDTQIVYVSSLKAKVYQNPTFNSPVIMQLNRSSKVAAIDRKGMWVKISLVKESGWVTKFNVTEKEPIAHKISIFDRIKKMFSTRHSRDRVSVVSTAGGIRGLSDGEVDSTGTRNFESVKKIESIEINQSELDAFIRSGERQ
mgnify:FL=1